MLTKLPIDRQGEAVALSSLPSRSEMRWTPLRKERVVLAVAAGILPLTKARSTYGISLDEWAEWVRKSRLALERNGLQLN